MILYTMVMMTSPRYPYAIVGIDLASMIWDMLERRVLYPHLYKTAPPITLQHVMELFCECHTLHCNRVGATRAFEYQVSQGHALISGVYLSVLVL